MNSQAIGEFVRNVAGFGPVRAKSLRDGKEILLNQASVEANDESLFITAEAGEIAITLSDVEQIIFAPEKQKYFVHTKTGLVEVRPDGI